MSPNQETCPKCGDEIREIGSYGTKFFSCGTELASDGFLSVSRCCKLRQRVAELESANAKLQRLVDRGGGGAGPWSSPDAEAEAFDSRMQVKISSWPSPDAGASGT